MNLQDDTHFDETHSTPVPEDTSSSPTPTPTETPTKTKRIMRSDNPIIQACLGELFRFSSPIQIETRLRSLRRQFVCVDGDEHDSLILWVHDFQITSNEDTQGFVGHFACISGKTLLDGALTLSITKVPMPLADHPHKKRPKQYGVVRALGAIQRDEFPHRQKRKRSEQHRCEHRPKKDR